MTDEEEEPIWTHVPSPLEDPGGWLAGWWSRLTVLPRMLWNFLDDLESLLFVGVLLYALVRFATHRRISTDLYVAVGLLIMLAVFMLREFLKARRKDASRRPPAAQRADATDKAR